MRTPDRDGLVQRGLRALLALSAIALPSACTEPIEEKAIAVAAAEGGCELADPVCHRISSSRCDSDDECPSGTICDALPIADASKAWPDFEGRGLPNACRGNGGANVGSQAKACQLPRGRSRLDVLPDDFHVTTFDIERVRDETASAASFRWHAPEGTRLVACALFGCTPVIRQIGQYEDVPRYEIVNFERCALAATHSVDREGVFDLADAANELTPSAKPDCADGSAHRFVAELKVGCWAFDATRIVAASALKPVDPRIVYNYQAYRATDCSTVGQAAAGCVLDDGTLGLCHQDTCTKTCVSHADCGDPLVAQERNLGDGGAASSAQATAGTSSQPTVTCSKDGGYVGVCLEE